MLGIFTKRKNKFFLFSFFIVISVPVEVNAFDPEKALQEMHHREATIRAEQVRNATISEETKRYKNARYSISKIPVVSNDDGTVTIGGLQWMRCSLGQTWNGTDCTGDAVSVTFRDAHALPGLMNRQGGFAGYDDWRLPTIKELAKLRICTSERAAGSKAIYYGRSLDVVYHTFEKCSGDFKSPAIDNDAFINSPMGWTWSSDTGCRKIGIRGATCSWAVHFGSGRIGEISFSVERDLHVRLVRCQAGPDASNERCPDF